MTDQEFDRLIKYALLDAVQLEFEQADTSNLPVFQPSIQHQRQIRAMLNDPIAWKNRRRRPLWQIILGRVAIILLVGSLSLGAVMVSVPSVRASVIQWVTEFYHDIILYRYHSKPVTPDSLPQYAITALPEGFKETHQITSYSSVVYVYENTQGDSIYFSCISMQNGNSTSLLTDNTEISDINIFNMDGKFIKSKSGDYNTLTWTDDTINVQFIIDGYFDFPELLYMAESISSKK